MYASLQDEEEGVDTGDGWDEWSHGKALIKPSDQVELTEAVREQESSLPQFRTGFVLGIRSFFSFVASFPK